MGLPVHGGHKLSSDNAEQVIAALDERGSLPHLGGREAGSQPDVPSPSVRSSAVLQLGHSRALDLLRDVDAVRTTLARYQTAIGAHVYLRVTAKGLTVISLDHARCKSMIGVGPRWLHGVSDQAARRSGVRDGSHAGLY